MSYYFAKTVEYGYEEAIEKIAEALKEEGFGILADIDVKETLKKKIDVDIKPYKILGACNPPNAYKALAAEKKIGLMLPCNVIVYVDDDDKTIISAIDPVASMVSVGNDNLNAVAENIGNKLKSVIEKV